MNGSSRSVQLSRNQPENTLAVWLVVVGLFLSVPCAAQAEPTLTPSQVVFQWLAWYPQDLPKAAMLTTTNFRDGLSPKAWIEKRAPLLKDLQFKYLEWKILEEDRDEVTAVGDDSSPTLPSDRRSATGRNVFPQKSGRPLAH